ncbi:MAG: YdeI/OmpD-associated family protein [candidate division WOR-3 bacterium]|nr:MAG: YdeI/OmpD-associated family protein [candidate division WOR-3 bacterium]
MIERTQVYMKSRAAWRAWLNKNHKKKKEVWLVYYKKHTRKPTVAYNDAVEEALCFGWIDSIVRTVDNERYMQKYTPRRPDSVWSQINIRRARKMIKQGLMTGSGLALFNAVKKRGRIAPRARDIKTRLAVPVDLKEALKKKKKAYDNFMNFAPSYKAMYIYWINDAKKPETRARRILRVVGFAEANKKSVML